MQIRKTTELVRVEVLTQRETETKLLKNALEPGYMPEIKGADRKAMHAKAEKRLKEIASEGADPENRVTFIMAPLTAAQKSKVKGFVYADAGRMVQSTFDMGVAAIKASLKGVEGIQGPDGETWVLPVDKDGQATDEAIDDLLNLPFGYILESAAAGFSSPSGIPKQIVHSMTGTPLANVEVVPSPKR